MQWACATSTVNYASESSRAIIYFDNFLLSTASGTGLTFIFRPFSTGAAGTNCYVVIGLANLWTSSAAGVPNCTLGVWWRYTSSTGNWTLIADNGAAIATVAGSQANVWCKINILRTGTTSFTSTFTIIGGATTTGSGSVASATNATYIGLIVGNDNTGVGAAKYLDLDYIGAEFNSVR